MFEDGTWKQEIGEKDQIIALATKLTEMQAKFEQQVVSFATQATNNKEKNSHLNQMQYLVAQRKHLTQLQHGI
jgi:hypothetical protein